MDYQQAEAASGRNELQQTAGRHKKHYLLQMYESSKLYDCTFKVGSEKTKGGCKVRTHSYMLLIEFCALAYLYT
jgi:hypothetical protein